MAGSERRQRPYSARITSVANDRIRSVRALQTAAERRASRRFLAEGVRLVETALAAGRAPELVLVDDERLSSAPRGRALLEAVARFRPLFVSERVLRAVSDTETPQGIVAVFAYEPEPALPPADAHVLVLDGVQDPGNVGTALRSAEAAGFGAVALTRGSADVYAPKVVRAAAGAHFVLALFPALEWTGVERVSGARRRLVATADAESAYFEVDWRAPTALVIGSEVRGASAEARTRADGTIGIPMRGRAESLNAGVAASIIVFEALRQRLVGDRSP